MSALQPGVTVEERLASARSPSNPNETVSALIGPIHRGPVDPMPVYSWTEFTKNFGAFAGNYELPYGAFHFFNNGGRELYIGRVIGAGAVAASRTFTDSGTTDPALTVNALSPGAWGNDVYVVFSDSVETGSYDMFVYYGGTAQSQLVERFLSLSNAEGAERDPERIVNSPRTGSKFVRVTKDGTNNPVSGESGEVLASGADGDPPTVTEYTDMLSKFDVIDNPVVLNLPGVSDNDIVTQAVQHAEQNGDLFLVVDPPSGQEPSEVVTWGGALSGSSYAAAYYPWVVFADPSAQSRSTTRPSPPGAAVLGQYARIDTTRGVWKAPAGIDTRLNGAVSLASALDGNDLASLNAAHINPLRHMPGAGITIHGARTLRVTNQADRYVNVRRSLIFLKRALKELFRFAEFESNDEATWSMVRAEGSRFLSDFWQQGGLRGGAADEAFFVKCDAEINDEAALEQGIMNIEVGAALQRPAEFVIVTLSQWAGGSSAVENL